MKSFETKGVWWLPEYPEDYLHGDLTFDPIEGIQLNLNASLIDIINKRDRVKLTEKTDIGIDVSSIPLLYGRTSLGDITLYECLYSPISPKIIVKYMFVGHHLVEIDENIKFNRMTVSFENGNDWFNVKFFDQSFETDNDGTTSHTIKRYTGWISKYRINDDLNIEFSSSGNTQQTQTSITPTATPVIALTSQSAYSFNDWLKLLSTTRSFLILATGIFIKIDDIELYNNQDLITNEKGKLAYTKSVSLFYALRGSDLPVIEFSKKQLFKFSDVNASFETYFSNWLSIKEKLEPIYDLYFGMFYLPKIYHNTKFLLLAQALEAYHRRIYGGEYMTEEEYNPILGRLTEIIMEEVKQGNINSSHAKSLIGRIKYGYQYALKKRLRLILKEVLKDYKEIIRKVIGNGKESDFAEKIANTRDYHTHFSHDAEDYISDTIELWYYTNKLEFILRLCFIHELGIPPEIIKENIKRSGIFSDMSR